MSLRIACAALAGGLALADPAQAKTHWGSIYMAHPSGYYGTSRGQASPAAARKEAAHTCNRQQHGFCREEITYSETCAAVAVRREMRLVKGSYAATGDTPRQARLAALKICSDTAKAAGKFFTGCEAVASTCARPR